MAERLLAGDRSALARLISWAENAHPGYPDVLRRIWARVGRARRIGVTGPPGAGKSTLVGALVLRLRASEATVGVLAIDPSSPFSGGALLGDRIRMEDRTADPGVYIRSMASRGHHGGLARAAMDACDVMDAFGMDVVLLETVGVGQSEYEVVSAADTVAVVLCPGAGDAVQAMKAGILEVADVLVVNKADQPGADRLVADLEEAVGLRAIHREEAETEWRVPVVACSALRQEGIEGVLAALAAHGRHLEEGDLAALRLKKRVDQVRRVVAARIEEGLWGRGGYRERAESSLGNSATPYDVAREILSAALGSSTGGRDGDPGAGGNRRISCP
jgi:LAO/AO transport system kinase